LNAQFISIPELGHGETIRRVDLVAPLVREFLDRAST
jgi:hypothetical protein